MSLSKKLATVQDRMVSITDELEAITDVATAEGRALSESDSEIMGSLQDEFDACEKQAAVLKRAVETVDRNQAARITETALVETNNSGGLEITAQVQAASKTVKHFASAQDAYQSGRWLLATVHGHRESIEYCRNQNLGGFRGVQQVGDDSLGGFTVPKPLLDSVIRLVLEYGVYPNKARQIRMSSMTLDVPVRLDGTTVFYPAENGAISASDVTFDQVQLVAKKMAQLTVMSNEIGVDADSIINMADLIVREMAHAFAAAIDRNSFLGDGTGAFGGITGIASALNAGSKVTSAATTIANITMDDLNAVVGTMPHYEGGSMPEWYIHPYTFYTTIQPLLQGLGGTDQRHVEDGGRPLLLGYAVNMVNVLPGKDAGVNEMPIVFGDLNLGCIFGVRRDLTVKTLDQLYAVNDQTGIVSTMRTDSICHSPGTATVAGPVIGLFLAAAAVAAQRKKA